MGLCKFQRFVVERRNLAPNAKIHPSEDIPQSGDIHHNRFITALHGCECITGYARIVRNLGV